LPDKLIVLAVVNFAALDELPIKLAVIVPALKLPEASLLTIILAVDKLVASLILALMWLWLLSVTVTTMFEFDVPSKSIDPVAFPLNESVLAVANLVALDAVPLKEPLNDGAVIDPEETIWPWTSINVAVISIWSVEFNNIWPLALKFVNSIFFEGIVAGTVHSRPPLACAFISFSEINTRFPVPFVLIFILWSISVANVIVSLTSSITFFPFTYNELAPTCTSSA